ncbi:MAG: acetyl-CoA acetyltransferase [Proteobacteria bacterium]|nr:acetyl-CoA acetyltransferase [Pseudomonadota bacterium]
MRNESQPVLIGVGQVLNRLTDLRGAQEPLMMMQEAANLAATDATGSNDLLSQVDSVRVIRGVWPYRNPAGWLARTLNCPSAQTVGTLFGGNQVQAVVNRTALEIQRGERALVLITGAENGYSAARARKQGQALYYTETSGAYDLLIGAQKPEHHDLEIAKGIKTAIQVYPMYENAIRHNRSESLTEHMERVSGLWSRFSAIAADNPNAWIRDAVDAKTIRTASPTNRPISFPYTKLMNANMSVNMGGALLMCTVQRARDLGVPEQKWIYPLAGVEGYDHFSASVRADFHRSPGIRLVGQRLFDLAGVSVDDLTCVDLYSCFPSAVQVAARELGLSETRPLTVTGGLTFGGGPLNNYVMHSIARTVELLRDQANGYGLVTANGGNLYKHAHGLYATEPNGKPFQFDNVQAQIDALPSVACLAEFEGTVTIESYTVMFGAQGLSQGHFACRTGNGERVWANTSDQDLMAAMTHEEFCGRPATLAHDRIRVIG